MAAVKAAVPKTTPPNADIKINLAFEHEKYAFAGKPIDAVVLVSVTDATGKYIIKRVELYPTSNARMSKTVVKTSPLGPRKIPITIMAPGDVSVDAVIAVTARKSRTRRRPQKTTSK